MKNMYKYILGVLVLLGLIIQYNHDGEPSTEKLEYFYFKPTDTLKDVFNALQIREIQLIDYEAKEYYLLMNGSKEIAKYSRKDRNYDESEDVVYIEPGKKRPALSMYVTKEKYAIQNKICLSIEEMMRHYKNDIKDNPDLYIVIHTEKNIVLKDIWPLFVDVKNFRDEYILLIHSEGDLESHTTLKIDRFEKIRYDSDESLW